MQSKPGADNPYVHGWPETSAEYWIRLETENQTGFGRRALWMAVRDSVSPSRPHDDITFWERLPEHIVEELMGKFRRLAILIDVRERSGCTWLDWERLWVLFDDENCV